MILTANLLAEDSGIQGIDSINSDPNYNFLSKIIDNDNDDDFLFNNPDFSPYSEIDFNCAYIGTDHFRNSNPPNNISVISLNIQSLPAKYNELCDMLGELSSNGLVPEVICLQETWQIADPSL